MKRAYYVLLCAGACFFFLVQNGVAQDQHLNLKPYRPVAYHLIMLPAILRRLHLPHVYIVSFPS